MTKGLYTLYDRKAGCYGTIFIEHSKETACRLVAEAKIPYKNDMELYQIGEYNMKSGTITAYEKPEFIQNLMEN